jgi:hypothetical protein
LAVLVFDAVIVDAGAGNGRIVAVEEPAKTEVDFFRAGVADADLQTFGFGSAVRGKPGKIGIQNVEFAGLGGVGLNLPGAFGLG